MQKMWSNFALYQNGKKRVLHITRTAICLLYAFLCSCFVFHGLHSEFMLFNNNNAIVCECVCVCNVCRRSDFVATKESCVCVYYLFSTVRAAVWICLDAPSSFIEEYKFENWSAFSIKFAPLHILWSNNMRIFHIVFCCWNLLENMRRIYVHMEFQNAAAVMAGEGKGPHPDARQKILYTKGIVSHGNQLIERSPNSIRNWILLKYCLQWKVIFPLPQCIIEFHLN